LAASAKITGLVAPLPRHPETKTASKPAPPLNKTAASDVYA